MRQSKIYESDRSNILVCKVCKDYASYENAIDIIRDESCQIIRWTCKCNMVNQWTINVIISITLVTSQSIKYMLHV